MEKAPKEVPTTKSVKEMTMQDLFEHMHQTGASDLLVTAGTPPQLRIHGSLNPVGSERLTPKDTERLAVNLMNEKQAKMLEERKSVDFSVAESGPTQARFRLNIYFQRGSYAMVARMIPFRIPSFDELGLPDVAKEFAMRPHGLVLITGPAGTGKSTTMASMIEYISSNKCVHVVCIEDPIEYSLRHNKGVVDQREILGDTGSFEEALKSVFRQSPDVIMLGEMRDHETIQLALTLAETGHLILATLHTHDTTNAISRIVDVFPESQQQQIYTQLSMILVGIIAQTLVPRDDGKGRALACEVMAVNRAIKNIIRERKIHQIYSSLQTGKADGMMTMNDSLKRLCDRGVISKDAAMERTPNPKELAKMLERSF